MAKRNAGELAAAKTALGWLLDVGLKLVTMVMVKLKARGVNVGEAFARLAGADGESELKIIAEQIADLIAGAGNKILNLLTDQPLLIPAVGGSEVLADADDVFEHIDPDFRNWKADEPGSPTVAMPVQVYVQVQSVCIARMFNSLLSNPAKLCLTQAQIKAFVKAHRNWLNKYGTLFLFRSHDRFFAASVYIMTNGSLEVNVRRFEGSEILHSEYQHRVVVPQLA